MVGVMQPYMAATKNAAARDGGRDAAKNGCDRERRYSRWWA